MALFKRKGKDKTDEIIDKYPPLESKVLDIKDLFVPDMLSEYADYAYLGPERYVRSFVVTAWPHDVYVGWLDDLFSAGEIELSCMIEPIPDNIVSKKLTEKDVIARSELITYQKNGNIYYIPVLEAMVWDLEELRSMVQTGQEKMYYASIFVTLHARTKEELEYKTSVIEDTMARKNAQIRVVAYRQVEALRCTLPVNGYVLDGYDRNITSGGVASMFPISNPDITHSSGIYLGSNLFTGAPMFIDNFIGPPQLNNQHITVFGIPGSGKSVTLKCMIARNVLRGVRSVVLDPENEYKKLADMLDGQYIYIKQGRPSGINIFELEPDIDETGKTEYVPIMEKMAEIRGLMGMITTNFMGRPLTALEAVAVEESVAEIYRDRGITKYPESLYEEGGKEIGEGKYAIGKVKKKMPTLSTFKEKLATKPNGTELASILTPFLKDGSIGMFDCETTVTPDSYFIGFNLFDVQDEFTKLYASYIILSWIWQKFVQRYRADNKIVAVDESWMFVKYPESAKFLETLSRRGRKHHTSLIVSSQFIDEFLNNPEGQAVIKSCATSILMRQHPGAVDQIIDSFSLSSGTRNMLMTFNPGECLVVLNGSVTAVKVSPTNYEWPYVTT